MPYRVAQWATGAVGALCLQEVIRSPEFELAGLYVYSPTKKGKDAGEIAGTEPTGILATDDREAIIATDADCVIYTPLAASMEQLDDDLVALLSSGKNVITTAGYFAPEFRSPAVKERLEKACAEGDSSLLGTGIEPGFMFDRVAPTLTGMCADIDYMNLVEIVDATEHPAAMMLKDALGIGKRPEEVTADTPYGQYWAAFFSEMVTAVARPLRLPLDRIETGLEVALASRDLDIAIGHIPAGTVVGNLHTATGIVDGAPMIRAKIYWFVERGVAGWPVPADRYRWEIEIQGRPSLKTVLDPLPSLSPGGASLDPAFVGTMATVVNAIPMVCASAPGILHASVFAPWTRRTGRS
jgi:4-hydroxy-tetrahydrodipicolinate reductase